MCKFPIYLHFIRSSVSHNVQVLHFCPFHQIFSVPFWASSLSIYISLYIQCPIWGKFPIYLHSIRSSVSHMCNLFTFHYIFSFPLCACSLTSYVSFLPFIISSVSHYVQVPYFCYILFIFNFSLYTLSVRLSIRYVQVPYLFTFHYIFSVPFWASSLSIYISLDSFPLCASVPNFLCFISSVSHFWASTLQFYVSLYLQCPIMCKFSISFTFHYIFSVPLCASSPIFLHSIISSVSHYVQVPYLFTFHYIFSVPLCASSLSFYLSLYLQCPIMGKFPIFLPFIISLVSHYVQVLHIFTFSIFYIPYIFSVPFWASTLQLYVSLFLQCPIMCQFSIFLHFILYLVSNYVEVSKLLMFPYIFSVPLCASSLLLLHFIIFLMVSLLASTLSLRLIISFACHYVQVPYLFTFHYIFSVPFWASSLSIYISLYIQCPIWGKFPIYLHSIRYSMSHYVHVPYLFTFHYIFSVPLCASSPFFSISLYLQCPILGKFPIYLHSIRYSVSHFGQVPYLFTFHQIFSVPLCACSLSFYLSLYLQFPIMCKFPIFLPFIISFVSHYVQVLHLFTFHYIFSVPFWASTLQLYVSLFLQCPIMCQFSIFLHFILYLVSNYVEVSKLLMFPYIFSVPLCASSLLLLHFIIFLMVSLLASTLSLRLIISFACHYVQVPYLFTFHQIFSVPFWASSLSIYISLYIQCPIWGKFPIYLHSIRYSMSHYVHVPYLFTFHYIFSVPLCASSPFFSISLYLQCPILGKFPIYLHSIRYSVSHFGQVPYLFTFHQIFSVPLCACSLSFYLSLYLQFPIMCKFPNFLCFVISSVSHSGQVPYSFTFHYIFSVPLCASSPYFYISFYIQCPILCKFPNFLCFVISSVSHCGQVPNNFLLHYIFIVPLCASSLSIYISLDLQCPIMCKFSIFFHFIISLVSHFGQVPYLFTFHQIFSVPFWASSLSIHISLYLQCPIWGKFPIYLHSIRSSVSHYVHVPYLFTFHYIFSFPLCASTLTSYVSLYLQCPILGKYPIVLRFIISSVSHYVQVLHIFTFHSIFSVPFCASSLTSYVSLYLQCPILGKYPIILSFIIYLLSHYVQVPYLFTFQQIFSVPLCASSPFFSISLYLQCPILGKFPIYLHSIRSSVSHYVHVPYLFTFHYIFSFPLCASSLTSYVSLYLQCPILGKYPIVLRFIRSSVSHYVQVLHFFPFHYIFSFPFLCASSLLLIRFIIFLVSHSGQVTYSSTFHYICSVPL